MKLKDMKFIQAIKEHAPNLLQGALKLVGDRMPAIGAVTSLISGIGQDKRDAIIHALDQDYEDIANARSHDVAVQNSEFGSWMSKNVAYIIDLFIVGIWGFLTIFLIVNYFTSIVAEYDKQGIQLVWTGVSLQVVTIINFHRGSSQGSKMKDFLKR